MAGPKASSPPIPHPDAPHSFTTRIWLGRGDSRAPEEPWAAPAAADGQAPLQTLQGPQPLEWAPQQASGERQTEACRSAGGPGCLSSRGLVSFPGPDISPRTRTGRIFRRVERPGGPPNRRPDLGSLTCCPPSPARCAGGSRKPRFGWMRSSSATRRWSRRGASGGLRSESMRCSPRRTPCSIPTTTRRAPGSRSRCRIAPHFLTFPAPRILPVTGAVGTPGRLADGQRRLPREAPRT